ncbi:caffeine-induced death protein, putative [Babesia ovis]|uniref:Caffeine-induced death protein, putative n=1 Tax=Babesia ovis TaxID=5869 RepID=A0A9W5TCG3_BABOV|nr:caffeine-induced death protein, putative [Babesia ovis]
MIIALCRKCVKLEWSNVLYTNYGQTALGLLEELCSLRNRRFAYTKCSSITSIPLSRLKRSAEHKDGNTLTQSEDEPFGEISEDDSFYPMHLVDINRNKNWENAFMQLRRQREKASRNSRDYVFDSKTQDTEPTAEKHETSEYTTPGYQNDGVKQLSNENLSELDRLTLPGISNEHLKTLSERIVKSIEVHLRERLNPKCSVSVFGSAINGLWTDASDLDICVQIPNVTSRSATIRNLRRIAFLLEPLAPGRGFENRFTAKIPILHWKNEKTHKRAGDPLIQSFKCSIDISVNNVLAISNSALIGTYVACDPRVRNLVLALKHWARYRDLNDRSKGTLGSFALSIMAIHFLQRCNPPILVSLQDLAISDNETPKYVSGIDVRFTTNMERIMEEYKWVTKGVENKMDVMELLQEFFYYFGWIYTKNTQMPICIRSVDFQYMDTQPTFTHRTSGFDMDEKFLHVDNPFEVGVDVANISFHQRNRLISEIRRAHKILKAGGTYDDILHD